MVIVSAGNISFACDFIYGGFATTWSLNGLQLPVSGTNGTLDITTNELLSDVNRLQCFSNDLVYNTTIVLAVQVKLCCNDQAINGTISNGTVPAGHYDYNYWMNMLSIF